MTTPVVEKSIEVKLPLFSSVWLWTGGGAAELSVAGLLSRAALFSCAGAIEVEVDAAAGAAFVDGEALAAGAVAGRV